MLLSHKNNKIIPFAATGMDLETVILTAILTNSCEKKRSKKQRRKGKI